MVIPEREEVLVETKKRGKGELPRGDYRPSRAELEQDVRIDTDPETLAKAVMRGMMGKSKRRGNSSRS